MRKLLVMAMLAMSVSACGGSNGSEADPFSKAWSNIPALDMCAESRMNDTGQVRINRLSKPGVLQEITDPALNGKIKRITATQFGDVRRPLNSAIQAFNADETYFMLYHSRNGVGSHHLYNGETYQYVKQLSISARDIEQVYWDIYDKNVFYYLSLEPNTLGQYIRYDVSTDAKQALFDLTQSCSAVGDIPSANPTPIMPAWQTNQYALRCESAPFNTFIFNKETRQVSAPFLLENHPRYTTDAGMAPSPSGDYVFLQGDLLSAIDFSLVRELDVPRDSDGSFSGENSTIGRLYNGDDAYFSVVFDRLPQGCDGDPNGGVGTVTAINMKTGSCNVLVGESNGYGYPLGGVRSSAVAYAEPGWVATSIAGRGSGLAAYDGTSLAPLLFSEIIITNSNPDDEAVCRLAHSRSYGRLATQGGYFAGFGDPAVVMSPKGTRLIFNSDWYDSGSVDTYVIELPTYERDAPPPRQCCF